MRIALACLPVLAGCFGEAAIGGAVTHQAPPPPSGDGLYARVGGGIGWANRWGMVQASGDVLWLGDIAAAGGAVQATVFVDSEATEHNVSGIGVVARAFHGAGIGGSKATDELSLGVGLGELDSRDHSLDGFDLSFSAYHTTFDARDAMWTYGLHLNLELDPEVVLAFVGGALFGIRSR